VFAPASHPVLDASAAKAFEARLFGGDEEAEWKAMQAAGTGVALGILRDWQELGRFPREARMLVLAGKGHNGGDALLSAASILSRHRDAVADLLFPFGVQAARPLTLRAHRQLGQFADRVRMLRAGGWSNADYDLVIDGVFGFQFRPPLARAEIELFRSINQQGARFKAAVDLPSGLGDEHAFQADFTYATGIVKTPLLEEAHRTKVGRVRYVDLGFFVASRLPEERSRVLTASALKALNRLRPAQSDKRHYGHLFVVGGSLHFPGAVLMAVEAALRTGVGLITAFVPEPLVPAYAAQCPEAMWVGCPTSPEGGIALESHPLIMHRAARATALLVGPGLGRDRETLTLISEVLSAWKLPAVLDADALQRELTHASVGPRVLTPHAGEYQRIAGEEPLRAYAARTDAVVVRKGAPTCISDGKTEYHCLCGGPALARGGSGDILAGMIGGIIAQGSLDTLNSACAGVMWHGLAADAMARHRGAVAVRTTDLFNYLPAVVRGEEA
jgi:ADP-dependent NAD(P)H-hydrate dehydratase / NAD(P)H-hydrate epimerase